MSGTRIERRQRRRRSLITLGWPLVLVMGLLALLADACGTSAVAQPGAPRVLTARTDQTTTLLQDGRVLVVAGYGPDDRPLASVEIYDPAGGTWSSSGALRIARSRHAAVLLDDGRVLVTGGSRCEHNCTAKDELSATEIFDPTSDTWTPTGALRTPREDAAIVRLADGRVLIAGGNGNGTLRSVEIYNPTTGVWRQVAPMHNGRFSATALLLSDGRVMVAGGDSFGGPAPDVSTFAELYDPESDQWTPTAPAGVGEIQWAGVLPNGAVLALGGPRWPIEQAALYGPGTDRWTSLPISGAVGSRSVAALLADGSVLAIGGEDPAPRALAEVWRLDPTSGIWSQEPSMAIARDRLVAVPLQDGRVLVYGGRQLHRNTLQYAGDLPVVTSEVLSPALNTWSPTGR